MTTGPLPPVYVSGECEIDLARRELRICGAPVPVGPRAFGIVEVLAQSAGEIVTKHELMDRVWPSQIVNDNTLQMHISSVRKALASRRTILKTEFGRGYRLLGTWTAREPNPAAVATPQQLRLIEKTPATNIPVATADLIGRSTAIQQLCDLASAYRLVTLTGPGGIGKTALGLEVAACLQREFEGAAWLVELASLSDPDLVPAAVASVLGLSISGKEISAQAVARAIGETRLLLLLDNCEHLIDATAQCIEALVRTCPRITILATSREILRIDGEHVYRVPPLEVPAVGEEEPDQILGCSAVELFVARTKRLDRDFSPNVEALPGIGAICRCLDGIPLAIEFAAALAAGLGVQEVAAGLHDRFRILTRGRRTALPRHQTLRATVDWSYELLTQAEQQLFCQLAVFPAGFTADAAAAVINDRGVDPSSIVEGITNLVAKSLVGLDRGSVSRWYLLETIRAYALDKLAARGECDSTARRHATYFRDFFVSAVTDFGSQVPAADATAYAREIDNVRAALDWCFSSSGDVSIGIDLTAAYAPIWLNLSLVAECRERCERALRSLVATRPSDARLRMRLQIALGSALLHTLGPSQEAKTLLTDALAAADALSDRDAQARALSGLTGVHSYRGEYAQALTTAERIRQIAHQKGDEYEAAVADTRMGIRLMTIGRLGEARRSLEQAIRTPSLREDRGPLWVRSVDHALARASLARVLWLQGFAERALREAQLSRDEAHGAPRQVQICRVLYYGIGRIAPMTGDFALAADVIAQMIELARGLNARIWVTAGQLLRGKMLIERGAFAEGLAQMREAFDICEETGWRLSYPEFMSSLALAYGGLERLDEANDAASQAIAGAGNREDGQQWYVPEILRIKAEIALRQTADHAGLADDWFEQAATMAREQGALTLELRIALSLARLRVSQGRPEEGRQILASVYNRFTEGFSTADLKAAKDLLDTLQ